MVTRKGMAALILVAVSLAGCNGARSISNSGYPDGDGHRRQVYPDMADRGPVAVEIGKPLMVAQASRTGI